MDYQFENDTLFDFLQKLSSKKSVPGGGSASCITAATSVALILKSLLLSEKRIKDSIKFNKYVNELRNLLTNFIRLSNKDAEAYNMVVEVIKSKEPDKVKKKKIDEKLVYAAEIPLSGAKLMLKLVNIANQLSSNINPRVKSDFDIGVALSKTAFYGFKENVLINLQEIEDITVKDKIQECLAQAIEQLKTLSNTNFEMA